MEIPRLFDVGRRIATTPMIAGGWKYTFKGSLRGIETFGYDKMTTEIFEHIIDTKHEYRDNGVIITTGNKKRALTGFGIFAGIDQPFTMWEELTVSGVSKMETLDEFCNILKINDIECTLETVDYENSCVKFVLNIPKKTGYLFVATPAPYVNGCDFVIVNADSLNYGKKDRKM